MGEKGVGKLSQGTPPQREGEPMGAKSDTLAQTVELLPLCELHSNYLLVGPVVKSPPKKPQTCVRFTLRLFPGRVER